MATTVELSPPKLTQAAISQEVTCTRPMREGGVRIAAENLSSKRMIHCYGHGGAGWTTAFGSVERAIELFEGQTVPKNVPIRVIGAGCMGLLAAIELTRKGYSVKITAESLYGTASWRAGGYFALVSVQTSLEEQTLLDDIGAKTFSTFQLIEKGEHPFLLPSAIRFMPVYTQKNTEAGVEELVKKGMIPPPEAVTLNFGNGAIHPNYLKYWTYFMETSLLMQQFLEEIERCEIPIELQKISRLEEVEESIIFNCSGLGARELCQDHQVVPIRGHLLALNALAGEEHMDYMIYTKVQQYEKKEHIYLFPKVTCFDIEHPKGISCKGVVGGTFIPIEQRISEIDLKSLDRTAFDELFERTLHFFGV